MKITQILQLCRVSPQHSSDYIHEVKPEQKSVPGIGSDLPTAPERTEVDLFHAQGYAISALEIIS